MMAVTGPTSHRSSLGDPVVSSDAWQACYAEMDAFKAGDRLVFGFDLDPEHMRATIVGAGVRGGRLLVAPIRQFGDGVSEAELAGALDSLIEVWSPWAVGFDPKVSAGVVERLSRWGDRLVPVSGTDFYAACGRFHDAVVSRRLAHPGDRVLSEDVLSNAVRKYLGDAVWVPGRVNVRRSYVGLAALVRAVWLAEQPAPDVFFY